MMQPILSICIPTYNGEKTIKNLLDILLPQVFNDVEIIVSDNCSTDSTSLIIQEYRKKYSFIKYFKNESNIGADGNFLRCMKIAKGRFIWLISDDDLFMGDLSHIIGFLTKNMDLDLVYCSTANFYEHYSEKGDFVRPKDFINTDFVTLDKNLFFKYAKYYWGFVSSFIINKKAFDLIESPERFFGTYWLQSYIHLNCIHKHSKLGVVGGIVVGAGVYITQSNFDISLVDGVYYKKMLMSLVEIGFDKKEIEQWFVRRFTLLATHGIIKGKVNHNVLCSFRTAAKTLYPHVLAILRIGLCYCVPSFVCSIYFRYYRNKRKVTSSGTLNRPNDVSTKENSNGRTN